MVTLKQGEFYSITYVVIHFGPILSFQFINYVIEIMCTEIPSIDIITQVSCSPSNPIMSQSCALEANGVQTSISCMCLM